MVAGLQVLGRVRHQSGDPEAAKAHWLRALDLAWSIGHTGAICEALESLARLAVGGGDADHAAVLLLHAARLRQRRGLPVRPSDAEAVRALTHDVRSRVGQRWDGMERLVPLTSVQDVVTSLLQPGGARSGWRPAGLGEVERALLGQVERALLGDVEGTLLGRF